VLTKLG